MSSSDPLYASLLPVVDVLLAHGNRMADGGFLNSPGGWYCRMTEALDIEMVERELKLPASVSCSREADAISDKSTWATIVGPRARQYWPDR